MTRKNPLGAPRISIPLCDVRDVALAHLNAVKEEKAKNQRFLINSSSIWLRDISVILKKKYGDDYTITTKDMAYPVYKVGSFLGVVPSR